MAAAPEVDENKLNFSDIDSDDEESESNQKPTIAHKDMSGYTGGQNDVESKSANSEVEQTSGKQTFEPISPVSDTGNNFEAISPPVSPKNKDNNKFETISDDEDASKVEDIPEGKFSPVQSENELNFDDESSNDSGYQLITSSSSKTDGTNGKTEKEKATVEKAEDEEDDDIEAPMPSPFSDLGDPNDIPGTDGGIIDDILKNSETNEQNFVTPSKQMSEQQNSNKSISSSELPEMAKTVETELPQENVDQSNEPTEQVEHEKTNLEQDGQVVSEQNDGLGTSTENPDNEATEESKEDAGYLIANIFGESDEEEEFVGFDDEDLLPDKPEESEVTVEKKKEKSSKDEESSDEDVEIPTRDFVSDFDLMLQKRKEMNRMKRRSKKDVDIINDNDDIIAAMLTQMKEAAEEDRISNQCGKAATKKLKMLSTIVQHLKKADLQHTFIDGGVLAAMKDWLSPLPDHALPHINIRRSFLKLLIEFPPLDKGALKVSGIGRAVMLLFKHPKETVENKRLAGKIINIWARPIFNMSANFHDMSREDREDRDKANLPEAKRRRLSSGASESSRNKLDEDTDNKPRKPGDKGWIGRARVPMPSHRDYVNRPESKVEAYDVSRNSKKVLSRYEKQLRKLKEKSTVNGNRKAVEISVNGTKLSL